MDRRIERVLVQFREHGLLILGGFRDYFARGGVTRAAALTYTTLLSLIPLLGLVVIVFKQVGGFEWLMQQLSPLLDRFLTPDGSGKVSEFLLTRVAQLELGTLGVFGVLFLGFGVYSLISTVETDFNGIWGVRRSRGVLRRITSYWLLMTLLPLVAAVSIFFSGEAVITRLLDALPAWVGEARGHLLPIFIQFTGFWFLYWALPNTRVRFLPAAAGALFAALAWELAKMGFAFYTVRAGSYNMVYGSIAALPLFMIWVFISWVLILLGAELSFVIQNRRALLQKKAYSRSGPVPEYLTAVAVANMVTESFRRGEAVDSRGLSRSLGLPEAEVNAVLGRLNEAGLIYATRGEQREVLVPARPPEGIKVAEVVALFLRNPADFREVLESAEFERVLDWMARRHEEMLEIFRGADFGGELKV